ncbi:MAG: hypothetical protein ACRYGR_08170, partial [Janthinobacterium lividum]
MACQAAQEIALHMTRTKPSLKENYINRLETSNFEKARRQQGLYEAAVAFNPIVDETVSMISQ